MAKYIDAETVVGLMQFDDYRWTVETDTIENILDNFTEEGCPEPADVVVPVRCEDCVYHGYDERFKEHWCGFVYGIMKVTLDGYCSNGIKRGGKRKE